MRTLKAALFSAFIGITPYTKAACDYSQPIRGFNVSLNLGDKDFEYLQSLNANALRVSFVDPALFLDDGLVNPKAIMALDKYIVLAHKYNIALLIDFHYIPGNKKKYSGSFEDRLWKDRAFKDKLYKSYGEVAQRLINEDLILGYDIINEAAPPRGQEKDYFDYITRVAQAIREKDQIKLVLVQPSINLNKDGIAQAQIKSLKLLPSELLDRLNLKRSIHFYDPGQFTHQGLHSFAPDTRLPTLLRSEAGMATYLTSLFGVQPLSGLIIGEFGVSNNAPAADANFYISTLIDFFEKNKFSWFYHSYREADIWNPEKVGGKADRIQRMKTLSAAFEHNMPICSKLK